MLPFMNELLNEKILEFLRSEAHYVPVTKKPETPEKQKAEEKAAGIEEITDNKETSGEQA